MSSFIVALERMRDERNFLGSYPSLYLLVIPMETKRSLKAYSFIHRSVGKIIFCKF